MARLLVATDLTSMGQRALAERLAERARADGHDTTVVQDAPLAACKDADAEPEPETLALPEEPFQLPSVEPEPGPPAPAPSTEEPAFQFPPAFTEPTREPQARREPLSVPEVALPSWLTTEPIAAAPASVPAQASVPLRTYEAPQPIFQPPAIPSFRIQTPPPAPHNRAKLWNLGKAGEKEEILEEFEDPDRIEPSVRDV